MNNHLATFFFLKFFLYSGKKTFFKGRNAFIYTAGNMADLNQDVYIRILWSLYSLSRKQINFEH